MSTKTCGCCKQTLPVENFNFKNKATGLRQSKCRPCDDAYKKKHYQANKQAYLDKAARHNETARAKAAEYVRLSLVGKKCFCCGSEEDLCHYQGEGAKTQPVHMTVSSALSLARVQEAIDRSKVLCETCRQDGFYSHIEAWGHMTQKQRVAAKARRTKPSPAELNPGVYKNYRRVLSTPAEANTSR